MAFSFPSRGGGFGIPGRADVEGRVDAFAAVPVRGAFPGRVSDSDRSAAAGGAEWRMPPPPGHRGSVRPKVEVGSGAVSARRPGAEPAGGFA